MEQTPAEQVFCTAFFAKPQVKHELLIQTSSSNYQHTFEAPPRNEPLAIPDRIVKQNTEGKFIRERSCFATFQDTEQACAQALQADFQFWKCKRFIKQPDEIQGLVDFFTQNASKLVHLFA